MEENRTTSSSPEWGEDDFSQLNQEDALLSEGEETSFDGFFDPGDTPFLDDDTEDGWTTVESLLADEPEADSIESGRSESGEGSALNSTEADAFDQAAPDPESLSGDKAQGGGHTHSEASDVSPGDSADSADNVGAADSSAPAHKPAKTDGAVQSGTGQSLPGHSASSGKGGTSGKELENTLERVQSTPAKKKKKKGTGTYKEKILRHKQRRYRRTILAVLLAMLLLTSGVLLWMHRGYRNAELRRVATLSAEDGTAYANLHGNVVQYGASGAVCVNASGDTLWNVAYEMQQPIVSVSGDVIAIANRSGYYVYIMDTGGLLGTIHTMLPIENIAAAENGEVAVITSDSSTTWVRLYSSRGKEIAYLVRTMEENGYPIAATISPDGETLCLSSLQISSTTVKTNVSFYNFGREGRNTSDHLVDNSDFIDETVPYVRYLDDSTCVGVSDKRLILFRSSLFHSGSTNILFQENLQGVFSNENFTGLLFTDSAGDSQYRLDIYNRRGKKNGSIHFSMRFNEIAIAGDKVYIHNEHQLQIYTLGGRNLYDGELSGMIRALIPGASLSDLLVVTGSEVNAVHLR
ncbi:MAG: DUF5711 family protein [Eubacteriales bacterium]|nr:DUF5711 family protein [Eubacteriales bacterium]